jgi:hypothetical protein
MCLLIGLALFPACGGSGKEVIASPEGKEGPFGLALEMGDEVVLTWRDQPDEFAYRVVGSVKYGPPCEIVREGVRGTEQLGFDKVLPPDTTRYVLPPPDDERLTLVLEVVVKITAEDGGGTAKEATDGMAFTADAFCE